MTKPDLAALAARVEAGSGLMRLYRCEIGDYQGQLKPMPLSAFSRHERQAQINHSQSTKELAQRGGLAASEAVAILEDRRWTSMDEGTAVARLDELRALVARRQDRTTDGD